MGGDYEYVRTQPVESWVALLVQRHSTLWQSESLEYWLCRLVSEVGELAAALSDQHEHPWQLEAAQVAAIATNMLKHHGQALDAAQAQGGTA